MMRLQLRCLQYEETRIFEVPLDCSIEKLKTMLSYSLFNTPAFASSFRLYIDKYDELSVGITSRDIIYYEIRSTFSSSQQQGKSQIEVEKREIKRSPELDLLKRVLLEDLGNDFRNCNKLVFAAIHSVFLESGFVAIDSVSGSRIRLFEVLKNQASMLNFTMSVSYTLPELILSGGGDNDHKEESSIVLTFQVLKDFVNVYGRLAKTHQYAFVFSSEIYSKYLGLHVLKIDKSKYVPSIRSFRVKDILELSRLVKDGLVLPLLMDLCEKTGLNPPPNCLIHLPTDLKFRILELLPGKDIAKMACVCKEMKCLSSDNKLWKMKYMSEFGIGRRESKV